MEKVIATLKKNGIKETDLPVNIQEKIDYLEGLIEQHNSFVDELESAEDVTDEQEQQVATQSDNIDSLDEKISNDIQSYVDEAKAKKDVESEKEAKAKKDAETEKTPLAPTEKKSSKGWLIFGALALVVTLGAVNVMNKD
jgi:hypothetical protein